MNGRTIQVSGRSIQVSGRSIHLRGRIIHLNGRRIQLRGRSIHLSGTIIHPAERMRRLAGRIRGLAERVRGLAKRCGGVGGRILRLVRTSPTIGRSSAKPVGRFIRAVGSWRHRDAKPQKNEGIHPRRRSDGASPPPSLRRFVPPSLRAFAPPCLPPFSNLDKSAASGKIPPKFEPLIESGRGPGPDEATATSGLDEVLSGPTSQCGGANSRLSVVDREDKKKL